MNAPIDVQILKGQDGKPAFAVIPYDYYIELSRHAPVESLIPHEVVGLVIKQDMTPIRAWREYLGLTQTEVAERLGISQPAYAEQENSTRHRKMTKQKIADALGLVIEQLGV